MTLIITDIDSSRLKLPEDCKVVEAARCLRHCVGCFGCWVKTPGECVIKDDFSRNGVEMSKCERLLIISRCVYGGYSPEVKRVLDRSISYVNPNFATHKGMMRHRRRYDTSFEITACFYGDITPEERSTATALVHANAENFYAKAERVEFYADAQAVTEVQL